MTKLSSTQIEILTAAAQSSAGFVEATPDSGHAAARLIKRGLVISMPQADGPSRLMITEAGRKVVSEKRPLEAAPGALATSPAAQRPDPVPTGKVGVLVSLLRRPEGATIEAMTQSTGWQAHSVRGAISGAIKKSLGLTVVSEKTDEGRVYRISAEADA